MQERDPETSIINPMNKIWIQVGLERWGSAEQSSALLRLPRAGGLQAALLPRENRGLAGPAAEVGGWLGLSGGCRWLGGPAWGDKAHVDPRGCLGPHRFSSCVPQPGQQ